MSKLGRQLRKNIAAKEVLHYILAMGVTIVFALFCSGRVGWFLVAMLGIAPFFSVLVTWELSKAMTYQVKLEKNSFCLEEKGTVEFLFQNRLRFNLAFLHLVFSCENGVEMTGEPGGQQVEEEAALRGSGEETLEFEFCTFSAGEASFRVESVEIYDLFHLVSFPICFEGESRELWIGVLPRILEQTGNQLSDQVILLAAADSEPEEDTVEKSTNQFGGFPGFEHRQYIPGDPVKRINWKLSAKKKELFVRLDELQGGAGIAVILDPYANEELLDAEYDRRNRPIEQADEPHEMKTHFFQKKPEISDRNLEQTLKVQSKNHAICHVRGASIERAISYLVYFLANNLSVQFFWYDNKGWRKTVCSEPAHLNALCEELAWVRFHHEQENRMPEAVLQDEKCKAFLYCTTIQNEVLQEMLENLTQNGQRAFSVSAVWTVGK